MSTAENASRAHATAWACKAVAGIVLPYVVLAGLWICFPARPITWSKRRAGRRISMYKDGFFVGVTGALLALLPIACCKRSTHSTTVSAKGPRYRPQRPACPRGETAQLRALLDTLPDLVWLKDPDGVYLSCNRRFEQFWCPRG